MTTEERRVVSATWTTRGDTEDGALDKAIAQAEAQGWSDVSAEVVAGPFFEVQVRGVWVPKLEAVPEPAE